MNRSNCNAAVKIETIFFLKKKTTKNRKQIDSMPRKMSLISLDIDFSSEFPSSQGWRKREFKYLADHEEKAQVDIPTGHSVQDTTGQNT
jgi:hypothetical protein